MSHTLVLGVGNTLLSDEGAGVYALHFLANAEGWPTDTEFLDAGTLSFTLADDIASAQNLLILDAAELGEAPGHVRVLEGAELDEFLIGGKRSVHEVGFADLMDIARLQGCLPAKRALIGIQPGEFGWGDEPGEPVRSSLPQVLSLAQSLLTRWRNEPLQEVVNR